MFAKKQTYIPKTCSIYLLTNVCSYDILNTENEQMFRRDVRMEDKAMRNYNSKISEKANESLRKREWVVRRQRAIFVIIFVLLISIGVLLTTSVNTLASSKKDISSYNKYYTSIKIESGDTLWTIADEYIDNLDVSKAEYIDEICQINEISEDEIHAGDYIVVPYYSDEIK